MSINIATSIHKRSQCWRGFGSSALRCLAEEVRSGLQTARLVQRPAVTGFQRGLQVKRFEVPFAEARSGCRTCSPQSRASSRPCTASASSTPRGYSFAKPSKDSRRRRQYRAENSSGGATGGVCRRTRVATCSTTSVTSRILLRAPHGEVGGCGRKRASVL
jgi:hypothetical protein